ncbi:hypothetical protein TNCV_4260251 [Trichonephila clavipes]|nr:hypothetical protein TNCV_4260251 [Trichonephila clavipes]
MPLSRMQNSTFVMSTIIDYPDMGLMTVLTVRMSKIQRMQGVAATTHQNVQFVGHQKIFRFLSVITSMLHIPRDGLYAVNLLCCLHAIQTSSPWNFSPGAFRNHV